MEDFLGFVVLLVVSCVLSVLLLTLQLIRRKFSWRKRSPRKHGGYRIEKASLICPTCLNNLNASGTASKISSDFAAGVTESILKCETCATESAWALLAQPPILYAYKKPENRSFLRFRRPAARKPPSRKVG